MSVDTSSLERTGLENQLMRLRHPSVFDHISNEGLVVANRLTEAGLSRQERRDLLRRQEGLLATWDFLQGKESFWPQALAVLSKEALRLCTSASSSDNDPQSCADNFDLARKFIYAIKEVRGKVLDGPGKKGNRLKFGLTHDRLNPDEWHYLLYQAADCKDVGNLKPPPKKKSRSTPL